jgi:hypothetical protein
MDMLNVGKSPAYFKFDWLALQGDKHQRQPSTMGGGETNHQNGGQSA